MSRTPPDAAAGAGFCGAVLISAVFINTGGAIRRATRADSQLRAARMAKRPRKTAHWALSAPGPESQCALRGAASRR